MTMKQQKQNALIIVLLLALVWSIVLNWLQSEQVSRLMEEIENMEYVQSVLSTHIDELENTEEAGYGEE